MATTPVPHTKPSHVVVVSGDRTQDTVPCGHRDHCVTAAAAACNNWSRIADTFQKRLPTMLLLLPLAAAVAQFCCNSGVESRRENYYRHGPRCCCCCCCWPLVLKRVQPKRRVCKMLVGCRRYCYRDRCRKWLCLLLFEEGL